MGWQIVLAIAYYTDAVCTTLGETHYGAATSSATHTNATAFVRPVVLCGDGGDVSIYAGAGPTTLATVDTNYALFTAVAPIPATHGVCVPNLDSSSLFDPSGQQVGLFSLKVSLFDPQACTKRFDTHHTDVGSPMAMLLGTVAVLSTCVNAYPSE
jgi:hypothetical protein